MVEIVYERLEPTIRVAVRALISNGQSILVQHKVYENGSERFVLPGGAPEAGETLEQGLVRECREEIGTKIKTGNLIHIADLFKPRSTNPSVTRHQLEMIFSCEVDDAYIPANGPQPDKHQVDVFWLDKSEIGKNFWPKALVPVIQQGENSEVYLGLIK